MKLTVAFSNFTSALKDGEWALDIPYVGERQPVWTSSDLDNCVDPGTVPLPTRLTHMTSTVYRSIEHSYLFRSHRPQYSLFHKALACHTANYATLLGHKLYLRLIKYYLNTFAASYLNNQGLNNSCLKSPASTLVDLTFQSRALRSFSLNQLPNLSL